MNESRRFLSTAIASALDFEVMTPEDVIRHLTMDVLAHHLPVSLKARLLVAALESKDMNAMLILDTLGIDALAEHLPAHLLWECVAAAAVRSLGEISAPIAPIKPGATTPTVSRPSSSARTAKPSRAVRASRPSSSPASRPVSVTAKVPVSGPVSTPAGPVASVSTPVPAVRAPAPSTNSPSEEGPDTTLSPAANTQPLGASRKPNRSARPARVRAGATSRGGTMPPPQAPAPMSDDDDSAFDVDTRVGGDPSLAGLDSIEDSPSDPGDEVTRYGHKI